MSYVIDNGNVHAVLVEDGWTPKLDGDTYCSPACGSRCKKADFDQANEKAHAIAKQLGRGWEPRVWENGGWNFEVTKGAATVNVAHDGHYTAAIDFQMSEGAINKVAQIRDDPRRAVEAVSAELHQKIAILKRALLSVSLDVIEIEFSGAQTSADVIA